MEFWGALPSSVSAWQVLAGITALERVLRIPAVGLELLTPSEDKVVYSGEALERGNVHTLVTANFIHGGISHMVNNVVMLGVVGPALEAHFGPIKFTAIYLGLGAMGWVGTYSYSKFLLDKDIWEAAGQFQEGFGSSPATYGLATLAAWVLPQSTLLGLPAHTFATTAAAVHVFPHVCGGKIHETPADVHELVLATALWSLAPGVGTALPPVVGPAAWLAFYHLNTGLTLVRRSVAGTRASLALTDHPAHFFGALAGCAVGALCSECNAVRPTVLTLMFLGARTLMEV